ncbi:hypothetical protein BDF14DRAFT_1867260 [Spinellus fusiger]|nr:hypothetical protein BDF14DRAFT_1867260 [Spinellus fusiger]
MEKIFTQFLGLDTVDDNESDHSECHRKDKKDVVDMELLEDVPAWFRSLRLHKYNAIFEPLSWQEIVKMDDKALQAKGVAALGARRKMLKVFEGIREHCALNSISY